ncbi:MAG: hypothetical protein ABI680_00955 [Chthoniobacteraceae bacterium]
MNRAIRQAFPETCYHPDERLLTWCPQGHFDDRLADRIMAFIELEERIKGEPFHRYTDLSGLTEIHLKVGHAFKIAERRRADFTGGQSVKSALYCDRVIGFGIARLYEALMEGGPFDVQAFRTREAAAEWLEVPVGILHSDVGDPPQSAEY